MTQLIFPVLQPAAAEGVVAVQHDPADGRPLAPGHPLAGGGRPVQASSQARFLKA